MSKYILLREREWLPYCLKGIEMFVKPWFCSNLKEWSTSIQGVVLWNCPENHVKIARFMYIYRRMMKVKFFEGIWKSIMWIHIILFYFLANYYCFNIRRYNNLFFFVLPFILFDFLFVYFICYGVYFFVLFLMKWIRF